MKITYICNVDTEVDIEAYKTGTGSVVISLKNDLESICFSVASEASLNQFIDSLKLASDVAFKK